MPKLKMFTFWMVLSFSWKISRGKNTNNYKKIEQCPSDFQSEAYSNILVLRKLLTAIYHLQFKAIIGFYLIFISMDMIFIVSNVFINFFKQKLETFSGLFKKHQTITN